MCTPTLALGLTAFGTYTGMQAASAQADAQQAQYNYEAKVADQNAKMAQAQAESNAVAGAQKAQQTLQRAQAIKASQAAAFSANGLDIGSGSPLDILSDTERLGQLDKSNLLFDTANNTWSLQAQETNYLNQASASRTAAYNAKQAGKMNRNAILLNGLSSIGSQYSQFKESGAIGGSKKAAKKDSYFVAPEFGSSMNSYSYKTPKYFNP